MEAVYNNHNSVVELLLKTPNIDVNIVTNYDQTALHLAVKESNFEALKPLLSHPSMTAFTLNQKDKKDGATPVMLAVKCGRLELRALLATDPRVDLDTTDKEGRGLEENIWWVFCKKGDLEEVKDALQRGIDVNTGEKGRTGLMWAVRNNHNSVVELLLKTPNIDVNLKDDRGYCALHHAVWKKNNEALKLLLNVPSLDVNIVTNYDQTALYLAVKENNFEALKLLLSHPSLTAFTLNQKDKKDGATPVMLAVKCERLELRALFATDPRVDLDTTDREGRGLEQNIWWYFCKKGDLEEVKDALQRGVNVNTKGEKGRTGLMEAVYNNHNSVVELLLKIPNIDVN